jgi:hypothetical protein
VQLLRLDFPAAHAQKIYQISKDFQINNVGCFVAVALLDPIGGLLLLNKYIGTGFSYKSVSWSWS